MGVNVSIGIVAAYVLLSLALLPFQYRYIKELKDSHERNKEQGVSTGDYYDQMSFEAQQLHFNAQGNLLFMGANLLATLVYHWKNRNNKSKKYIDK